MPAQGKLRNRNCVDSNLMLSPPSSRTTLITASKRRHQQGQEVRASSRSDPLSSPTVDQLRVLFVDDEAPIRMVMKAELPQMGHDVTMGAGIATWRRSQNTNQAEPPRRHRVNRGGRPVHTLVLQENLMGATLLTDSSLQRTAKAGSKPKIPIIFVFGLLCDLSWGPGWS